MKLVIRTLVVHLILIVLFTILYYVDESNFVWPEDKKRRIGVLDCFYLATTVQAGVGYTSIVPGNNKAKVLMIVQQMLMIASNVLTLYVFTL